MQQRVRPHASPGTPLRAQPGALRAASLTHSAGTLRLQLSVIHTFPQPRATTQGPAYLTPSTLCLHMHPYGYLYTTMCDTGLCIMPLTCILRATRHEFLRLTQHTLMHSLVFSTSRVNGPCFRINNFSKAHSSGP